MHYDANLTAVFYWDTSWDVQVLLPENTENSTPE